MSVPKLVVGSLTLTLLTGCSAPAPYVKPTTPVTTVTVSTTNTATSVRYSGVAKAASEVAVSFKAGGYVEDILTVRDHGQTRDVQAGDRIDKNAVLARVKSADYEQKVAQARAGVAEAEAMRTAAQLNFDRAARLFERHSLTKPELDGGRAQLDAALAKVEGAKAAVRELELLVADLSLRAPMNGVVIRRSIERGSLVAPGTPGFVIADTSTVKVVFGVPDLVVRSLRVGQSQTVAFEALKGQELEGRITAIAPAPDPMTRAYEIELTVPNRDRRIEIGFLAILRLADAPGRTVATVPLDAIVKPPNGAAEYAVFVVGGTPERQTVSLRPVTLGEALGNQIVVTSGLNAGEKIVARGATQVTDGEVVRVLPPVGTP